MATDNGYSDLIHLFIDGEATETERNILFGALKDSPELQEEFSSAMQLKQAFASDISKLQPPTYLQQQIAERAGIIVTAAVSAANAPVVTGALSTAAQNIAPVATGIFSKGMMTLVIGASVGILSTIGIIKLTSSDEASKGPAPVTATQNVLPRVIESAPLLKEQMPLPVERMPKNVEGQIPEKRVNLSLKSDKTNSLPSSIEQKARISDNVSLENNNSVKDNSNGGSGSRETITQLPREITVVDPVAPALRIGGQTSSHNPLAAYREESEPVPDWMTRSSFALSYRGLLGGGQFFQTHSGDAPAPAWDNFGIALKYDLSPYAALGAEGGQEAFPLYLKQGKEYRLIHSIAWAGISGTYSFYIPNFNAIHFESRALVGGSNAGFLTKFSIGAVMMDGQHFGFSISPEVTGLAIKQHGILTMGGKFGISTAFIGHF